MKRPIAVRVIQHVEPENPGLIATSLAEANVVTSVTRVDLGEPVPSNLDGVDGLIVMGGPMSVYEDDVYPHLRAERKLLEAALARDLPILGVCLGSQLLAATLGARVAPGPRKEIGFADVTLRDAAKTDALFGRVPATFTALHWHGDVFDLPSGAVSLARSALTEHQAFRFGKAAYGLLFHLETTTSMVEAWTSLFAAEVAAANVDPAEILGRAPAAIAETTALARVVFGAWMRTLSSV